MRRTVARHLAAALAGAGQGICCRTSLNLMGASLPGRLAPGLLAPPALAQATTSRRSPQSPSSVLGDRRREPVLAGELVGSLLAYRVTRRSRQGGHSRNASRHHRLGRRPIGTKPGGRGSGIDRRGSGSCCLQTRNQVDRPRETRRATATRPARRRSRRFLPAPRGPGGR